MTTDTKCTPASNWPGTHLTNCLSAYNWNLVKILLPSGHSFTHVTTAVLSWHVQSCAMLWYVYSFVFHAKTIQVLKGLTLISYTVCKMCLWPTDMPSKDTCETHPAVCHCVWKTYLMSARWNHMRIFSSFLNPLCSWWIRQFVPERISGANQYCWLVVLWKSTHKYYVPSNI